VIAKINARVGLHSLLVWGEERLYQNDVQGGKWPDLTMKPGAMNQPDPILFPMTGPLLPARDVRKGYEFDGQFYHVAGKAFKPEDPVFLYKEKAYSMKQHGFARDRELEVLHVSETACTLRLQSDAETLQMYPFAFEFLLSYELIEDGFVKTQSVKSTGADSLFFSIGEHTALKIEGSIAQYELIFDQKEPFYLVHPTHGRIEIVGGRLPLSEDLIVNKNTLSLENYKSKVCTVCKNGEIIMIYDVEAVDLHIWTSDNQNFLCVEPWNGAGGALNEIQESLSAGTLMQLEGGESYVVTRKMSFPFTSEVC